MSASVRHCAVVARSRCPASRQPPVASTPSSSSSAHEAMLFDTGPLIYVLLVALLNLYVGFAVARVVRSKHVGSPGGSIRLRGENSSVGSAESTGGPCVKAEPSAVDSADAERAMVAAMEQFRLVMAEHNDELSDVDRRLHEPEQEIEAVQQCAEEVKDAGERYLEERDRLLDEIEQYEGVSEAFDEVTRDVQVAVEAQAAAVFDTITKIDGMQFSEETIEETSQQLQTETGTLVDTCQELRGTIDDAIDGLASMADEERHHDDGLTGEDTGQGEPSDEQCETKLDDQDGLASRIADWCSDDSQTRGPLCMGIIDLDQFDSFISEYGPLASDRAVVAMTRLASQELEPGVSMSRYGANQLLFVFSDVDPQQATVQVERIRQQIEKTVVEHRDRPMRITVSCAVVEGRPGDAYPALLERALATLEEAKRYGRNRTFLYEGDCPAPVVPPDLDIQDKTISV